MAKKTINSLTLTDTINDSDLLSIWRASDGDTRAITKSDFFNELDTELVAARTAGNNDGATPVSLSNAIAYAAGGIYNVLAYGAVGDGSTDDTTAIQNTIDACETAGGGVVLLPPQTYKITSALTMPSNVILRGSGNQSIIDWAGIQNANAVNFGDSTDAGIEYLTIRNETTTCGGSAILTGSSSARIRVRNVKVLGNETLFNISSVSKVGSLLTVVTTSAHGLTTGDNVFVYGTGSTYDGHYGNITVVNSTTFTDGGGDDNGTINTGTVHKDMWLDGIRIQGTDSLVEGCHISTGIFAAMRAYGTAERNKFVNNFVVDVLRGFMADSEGGDGARDNLISGNTFHECAHLAVKVEDTAVHNIFSNNTISECSKLAYEVGTLIIEAANTTIENNSVYFASAISEAAISISTSAARVVVKGNVISGHSGYGIYARSGVQYADIIGNRITGGTRAIRFGSGATAYITCIGNRIFDVSQYGIYIGSTSGFIIQNNTIVNVTGNVGIYVESTCLYGSISGNMIYNCGLSGIQVGTSSNPSKYISITANVIMDVGNSVANAHILMSSNQEAISIVGNVLNDTPHADSIFVGNGTNIPVVGNTTSAGLNLGTGTTSTANY